MRTLLFGIAVGFACSAFAVEITDLGSPDEDSAAYAINDSGYVVGYSEEGNTLRTFVYHHGLTNEVESFHSTWAAGGINNAGQIAGGVVAEDGILYPSIYNARSGQLRVLQSLGGVQDGFSGGALAISNSGQATGYGYAPNGEIHSFLFDGNVMRDIGCTQTVNGCNNYAQAINESGQIVGFSNSGAFIYSGGVTRDIPLPPGGSTGAARGINNAGDVVGNYWNGWTFRAFLYAGGIFSEIQDDHSLASVAFAINNSDHIVGVMLVLPSAGCRQCWGQYRQHAFVFRNGHLTDLNSLLPSSLDWELNVALAINNHGSIVGYGRHHGRQRGFVLN